MTVIQLSSSAAKHNGLDLDRIYQGGEKIYEAIKVKPFNLLQYVDSNRPNENPVIATIWWTNRPPQPVHEYGVNISYTGADGSWIWVGGEFGTRFSSAADTTAFVFEGVTYYRHYQAFYISAAAAPTLKIYWRVGQAQSLIPISGQLPDGTPHPRYGSPVEPEIPIARMTTEIKLDLEEREKDDG